jgi:hypothetical protein
MSWHTYGKTYLPTHTDRWHGSEAERETETESEWYKAFGKVSPRWRVNQATAITAAADDTIIAAILRLRVKEECMSIPRCERTPMATNLPHHLDPLHIRSSVMSYIDRLQVNCNAKKNAVVQYR